MSDRPDIEGLRKLVAALPDALRFDCVTTMDNGRAMLHALGTQTTHAVASTHAAAYAIQDALRLAFAAPALLDHIARLEAALGEALEGYDDLLDEYEMNDPASEPEFDRATIARLRSLLPGTKETAP